MELEALTRLGDASSKHQDYEKAIDFYSQSLSIIHQSGKDRKMEQAILQRLGSNYLLHLEFGKAIDTLQQGLMAARENKDLRGEGFIFLSLGQAHSTSYWSNDNPNKDYVKATQYIEQSLLIAREQKYKF